MAHFVTLMNFDKFMLVTSGKLKKTISLEILHLNSSQRFEIKYRYTFTTQDHQDTAGVPH